MGWLDAEGEYPKTDFEFLTPEVSDIHEGVLVLNLEQYSVFVEETSEVLVHSTVFRDPTSKLRVHRPVFMLQVRGSSRITHAKLVAKHASTKKQAYVENN